MALPAEHVVVCPIVVGRDRHLESLEHALERLTLGEGQVIAIAGEAGLGKSRLVAEAMRRVTTRASEPSRVQVLRGHCFEGDASLPYAPIIDLLRSDMATRPAADVIENLGADAPEIVKILPELASIIPGLAPAPALEPEQEKRRTLQALSQIVVRAAARSPLLVVIEDLHWSDDTSLELLSLLARRTKTLPVLMILTYRSDEVQPALRQFLAGLDRERLSIEWALVRLSPREVTAMISAIFALDAPPRPEFVDALYALTEGNPFFLEEVLKSLVASGDIFLANGVWDRKPIDELQIPRSVHAAVAARTNRLSPDARHVLTLAAVAGRRFDFVLLQHLSGQGEQALLVVFKELIGAQLVVEASADHFAFRHALTQQAIYSDLLARERRSLHRTTAEMMRDLYGSAIDQHLAELAHHFYAAESWDEAYYYCQRVGENAQTVHSPRAAAEQFTRAIDAARHLGVSVPSSLYRARGQALETLGDFDRARADYELAFESTQAAGDRPAEWQSLVDLGFLWSGRDYERTGAYFRRASELADTIGDRLLQARSSNRLGNWLVNVGSPREGLIYHQSALTIFEAEGDIGGTAETLDLIGMANGIYGDLPASVEAYGRAIELLRPLGASLALSSSLASRSTYVGQNLGEPVYTGPGTLEAANRDSVEAWQLAETIGSSSALSYAAWAGGSAKAAFGDLGGGLAQAMEGLRIATDIGHDQWITGAKFSIGRIYVLLLSPDRAIQQLTSALVLAREVGSAWWIGNITTALALAHLLSSDPARAEAALSAVRPRDHAPQNAPERRLQWVWGLLALQQRDPKTALLIAERLLETAPGGPRDQYIPSLLHLQGDALLALKRYDDAAIALAHAVDGAVERGALPFLWQIHRSLGSLHQARRRPDDADREFSNARAIVASLGRSVDDRSLREQFECAALETMPHARPITANRAAKDAFGGLTTREREVAALIADGLSNRDIAEHLVLGERTIETHVSNVLSKLGFTSRAQVAAWAVEKGLPKLT
jgi:DNA-binding NarL/FixJ family response regulator